MNGRGNKHIRPGKPRKRNDLGARIDMPRYSRARTPFPIDQEGPRIGWMRSEPEVPNDHDQR